MFRRSGVLGVPEAPICAQRRRKNGAKNPHWMRLLGPRKKQRFGRAVSSKDSFPERHHRLSGRLPCFLETEKLASEFTREITIGRQQLKRSAILIHVKEARQRLGYDGSRGHRSKIPGTSTHQAEAYG